MTALTLDALRHKVEGDTFALVRISATLQPGGGSGSRVFPPTFPVSDSGESPYLIETRMKDGEEQRAVVLDQVPSQANRAQAATADALAEGQIRIPLLRLTYHGTCDALITSFTAPHRAFDAYWRDSLLDGVKFDKTELGKALQAASLADASALLRLDPGSIVYGAWNSHRKGRQEKFPRIYASEIVGWKPAEGSRKAGRMDPMNLTGTKSGEGDEWEYWTPGAKGGKDKLSKIGHGNIAPNPAHGGVTIESATRFATLSLTALARVRFGTASREQQIAARVYLAALALLGDRLAFGGAGLWLRSGCELIVQEETIEWVGRGGLVEEFSLSRTEAIELYEAALDSVLAAGVPIELTPVELAPSPALAKAMEYSLTKAESTGE